MKANEWKAGYVESNAFKGIHKKASINVPKSKKAAYKAVLSGKGIGKGVTVKGQ